MSLSTATRFARWAMLRRMQTAFCGRYSHDCTEPAFQQPCHSVIFKFWHWIEL